MKKNLLLIVFSLTTIFASANVVEPQAHLSELYFDSTGNWIIELGFSNYELEIIDSIFLYCSGGTAKIISYNLIPATNPNQPFDSLAIITNSNLDSSLYIDPNGDFARIKTYISNNGWVDNNTNGASFNSTNSDFPDFLPGQSIAKVQITYSLSKNIMTGFTLDNSPTIGFENDTVGSTGRIKGRIYVNNIPVGSGYFSFYDPTLELLFIGIDENGYYDNRFLARRYSNYYFQLAASINGSYPIEYPSGLFNVSLAPEEILIHDIYLNSSDIIEPQELTESANVITYPNPFTSDVSIYYDLVEAGKNVELTIVDLSGKEIICYVIKNKSGKIIWQPDASLANGTYIYQLTSDKESISSGRIVKQ